MLIKIIKPFFSYAGLFSPHSNCLGVARAFLAFSSFSILFFNEKDILFPYGNISGMMGIIEDSKFDILNIFKWFGYDYIIISKSICIVILLIVISGWRPRITCIPHFLISYSIFHSIMPINGGDQLNMILCLLLIPICLTDNRVWSLNNSIPTDDLNGKKSEIVNMTNYFFIALIRLQMSLLYLIAAISKLEVEEWSNGTALYYWINAEGFGTSGLTKQILDFLFNYSIVLNISTWCVVILELLLFAALFMSAKNKKLLLIFGLCFHFSIILVHGLVSFFFAVAAGLFIYLGPIKRGFNFNLNNFILRK